MEQQQVSHTGSGHHHPYSPEDFALAKRFAHALRLQLKGFLKEVVFFGSRARGGHSPVHESDIDVLTLVDDTTATLSSESVSAYRIITEKTAGGISARLHINTLRMSAFFEYVSNGDPVAVNIIRDGIPLLDAGIIDPLKTLLSSGKIMPTKENIMVYLLRAPQTLLGSRWHILQATIDLYWACLDACHALLIRCGRAPDSPAETMHLIDTLFVRNKRLSRGHLETLRELYDVSERIIDRSKKDVSGKEFSAHQAKARELIGAVKSIMRNPAAS